MTITERCALDREDAPREVSLPVLPEGQEYFLCDKVLRGGRRQKGMALTVGTEGVVVFTADYRPFKTYQLRSLMGWSSEGVGQSEDPQMHTRLKLKKRHGGVGSTVEFAMQPGDPKAVAVALTDVARELAAEAQRRGSEVTSLTPRKWGWAHKRPSAYRQTGTAPTASETKLQWNRRYFVLFAGKGIDAGKLLYFDTDASYTAQLAEHESTGAPFNPKGAIELAGAKPSVAQVAAAEAGRAAAPSIKSELRCRSSNAPGPRA